MKKALVLEILRTSLYDATERVQKYAGTNDLAALNFAHGRASAFEFALSLLDPRGPEAKAIAERSQGTKC